MSWYLLLQALTSPVLVKLDRLHFNLEKDSRLNWLTVRTNSECNRPLGSIALYVTDVTENANRRRVNFPSLFISEVYIGGFTT